jgi:hypothetical protein
MPWVLEMRSSHPDGNVELEFSMQAPAAPASKLQALSLHGAGQERWNDSTAFRFKSCNGRTPFEQRYLHTSRAMLASEPSADAPMMINLSSLNLNPFYTLTPEVPEVACLVGIGVATRFDHTPSLLCQNLYPAGEEATR